MPKNKTKKKREDKLPIAIVSLVINGLVMPGLGSIIGSKTKEGILQLSIFFGSIIVGISLMLTLVGMIHGLILIIFGTLAAWIWAMVTGIILIQEASN